MKGILKWPLIIAAVVVVLRVITERAGLPDSVNNLLSVVLLHTLLGPVYFSIGIARKGVSQPYRSLLRLILAYVVLTRLMLLPTYWLARIFEWTQPRFDGLWGPDVGPVLGYVIVPLATAALWVVLSIVFGGAVGSLIIKLSPRRAEVR